MGYKRTTVRGGTGGSDFEDNLTEVRKLIAIRVGCDKRVDSVQCRWKMENGDIIDGDRHGGGGGKLGEWEPIADDDPIISVTGMAGQMIDKLEFKSKKKTYGPYGDGGGGSVTFSFATPGLGGFYGKSGVDLNAIGFFYDEQVAK